MFQLHWPFKRPPWCWWGPRWTGVWHPCFNPWMWRNGDPPRSSQLEHSHPSMPLPLGFLKTIGFFFYIPHLMSHTADVPLLHHACRAVSTGVHLMGHLGLSQNCPISCARNNNPAGISASSSDLVSGNTWTPPSCFESPVWTQTSVTGKQNIFTDRDHMSLGVNVPTQRRPTLILLSGLLESLAVGWNMTCSRCTGAGCQYYNSSTFSW